MGGRSDVILTGFDSVADVLIPRISTNATVSALDYEGKRVGWKSGDVSFVLASLFEKDKLTSFLADGRTGRVFVFSDKYAWKEFICSRSTPLGREAPATYEKGVKSIVKEGRRGKKPKHLIPPEEVQQGALPVALGQGES